MSLRAFLADTTLDDLLDTLAERLAEHLGPRLTQPRNGIEDPWLTTRDAAQYLGMHPDNLRKLATARIIPSEQDGPGCVHHFRLSDLDGWRESGGPRHPGGHRDASTRLPRIGKAA